MPTNAQWRAAGNRALQRLERAVSREGMVVANDESEDVTLRNGEGSRPTSSSSVAEEGRENNSNRQLREANGFFMTEADDGADDRAGEYGDEFGEPLVLPHSMLGEPLVPRRSANAAGVRSDPASLRKAMTSLRHMLKNPLAGDFNGEEKTYMKRTNANKGMQKPRIPYVPLRERRKGSKYGDGLAKGGGIGVPGKKSTNPVLANIEYVLDQMNERVEQVESDMGIVQYTDSTMSNLIGLVNDVMGQFEADS